MRARLGSFALRLLFVGGLTVIAWLAGSAIASASPLGSLTGGSLLGGSPDSAPVVTAPVAAVTQVVTGGTGCCGDLGGTLGVALPTVGADLAEPGVTVAVGPVNASLGGSDDRSAEVGVAGAGVSVGGPAESEATHPPGHASARESPVAAARSTPPPTPTAQPPAAENAPAPPPTPHLLSRAPAPRAPVAMPQPAGADPAPTLPRPTPAAPAAPVVPSASITGHDLGGGVRGWHAVLVPQPHAAAAATARVVREGGALAHGHDSGLPSTTPD